MKGVSTKARTRTITWDDPMTALENSAGMSGLEFIRAIFEERLPKPPITATMGITGGAAEEGKVTFTGEAGEYLYNPIGVVHGGFAMTILDSAMGCAVRRRWPPARPTPRSRRRSISCARSRSRPDRCAARAWSWLEAAR